MGLSETSKASKKRYEEKRKNWPRLPGGFLSKIEHDLLSEMTEKYGGKKKAIFKGLNLLSLLVKESTNHELSKLKEKIVLFRKDECKTKHRLNSTYIKENEDNLLDVLASIFCTRIDAIFLGLLVLQEKGTQKN